MNNVEKIRNRFAGIGGGKTGGKSKLDYVLGAMQKIAVALEAYMIGDADIPVDTHNLKDSTGIALYSPGGVLRTYIPNPKAKVPRVTRGRLVEKKERWGNIELRDAIAMGAQKYNNGYYLVIYSSMPYAGVVNKNTTAYFSRIRTKAIMELEEILRLYKNLIANPA